MGGLMLLALIVGGALFASGGKGAGSSDVPRPTITPPRPSLTGPFKVSITPEGATVTADGPLSLYKWMVNVGKQLAISDDSVLSDALASIASRVSAVPIVKIKILSMGPHGAETWAEIIERTDAITWAQGRSMVEDWLRARGMI